MRIQQGRFILLLSLLCAAQVPAEESSKQHSAAELWEQTKQSSSQLWNQSVQSVNDWWQSDVSEENKAAAVRDMFPQVWQNIGPHLDDLVVLEAERQQLPDRAWFSRDKGENQKEMDKLLDQAVAVLGISSATQPRVQIRELEQQIAAHKQKIAEYRQARIAAPRESKWKTTATDYDDKIRERERDISALENRISQQKQAFAEELRNIGLELSQEQLDLLLSSVIGDDMLHSTAVYHNVRLISLELMKLTQQSQEEIAISRRYYGMYVVLLKALLHMQKDFIRQVDEVYLPKVEQIRADVDKVHEQTEDLLRAAQAEHRPHLQANLTAQQLTLDTAELYERHLKAQRNKMASAQARTEQDVQVAENTYQTVTLSGELVNLLRNSQKNFEFLLNAQVPELLIFENLQMKQEFAQLTDKLAR